MSSKYTRFTNLLSDFTNLRLSKSLTKPPQLILSLTLRITEGRRRSSRTSLSLIQSSLTLNLSTVSILHEIKIHTVGIGLSGLRERVLSLSPNRFDTGVPLRKISNSLSLSKLSFDLRNTGFKLLRKGIRFGSGLSKGKQRIFLLGLNSFSLSFKSRSIRKLNISLSLTSLENLLYTLREGRSNITERGIIKGSGRSRSIRRRARVRTGISRKRLNIRTGSKRINTSSETGSLLSGRRIIFTPIICILLRFNTRQIIRIVLLTLEILNSHALLPITIYTIKLTSGTGR